MNRVLASAATLLLASSLLAETLGEVGNIVVAEGEARAAGPAARAGAVYLSIINTGMEPDRLLSVESTAGQRVELHTTELENGVARMRPLKDGIPLAPGETVALEQGGDHVMVMGLTPAWNSEARVPLTLVFERAGPVSVSVPLMGAPSGGHHKDHQH